MKCKNFVRFLRGGVLLLAWVTYLVAQNAKPITFKGLVDSLNTHGLSNSELTQIVKTRGVDFELTPDKASQLKVAGADADLLAAIRAAYHDPAPSSDAPPDPKVASSVTPVSTSPTTASAIVKPVSEKPGATVNPQSGGERVAQGCVILKRMGPADQVTSHFYSFGIRGKQFQYVEGKLPEGAPFHGRLTDHDVRNLQARGAEIIVLDSHYTSEDLKQARSDCQSGPKAASSQAAADGSNSGARNDKPAAPQTLSASQPEVTKLSVASNPSGADIEVDASFVGNTPSTVEVAPGEHTVTVAKNGYKSWQRKLKTSGGNVSLNAELEAEAK